MVSMIQLSLTLWDLLKCLFGGLWSLVKCLVGMRDSEPKDAKENKRKLVEQPSMRKDFVERIVKQV